MNRILSLIVITIIITVTSSHANNLQIGPVTLTTANGSQYLNFTLGWNNSWRTSSAPFNWDAVWVFVKRRDCASLQWRHVNLAAQDTAHTAGTPLLVDAYADKKGVMVYRASDGSGTISNVNLQLKLDSVPAGNYDYQVFGIEMVYVPQGPFYLGDGISHSSFSDGLTSTPFFINGEDSILIGGASGNLYRIPSSPPDNGLFPGTVLSSIYPKGFQAFYIMKYEISQGQYSDFLNSLTQDAVSNRFLQGVAPGGRYTITGNWPQLTASTPNRACNYLSFQDLAAYLDWSALSPMTELEFEKSCRGSNQISVMGGMAWGGNDATDAKLIASGTDGTPSEYIIDSILTGTGLASFYDNDTLVNGPLRCGFAARSNSDRFRSGATYYGIMEMSGNLIERCYNVSMFNPGSGPTGGGYFNGSHGDGELSASPNSGSADEGWPMEVFFSFLAEGSSVSNRGGSFALKKENLRISDREFSYNNNNIAFQSRLGDYGGRGVSRRQQ